MNQAECKAKALELISEAEQWRSGSPTRASLFEEAQVYATLATIPDKPDYRMMGPG